MIRLLPALFMRAKPKFNAEAAPADSAAPAHPDPADDDLDASPRRRSNDVETATAPASPTLATLGAAPPAVADEFMLPDKASLVLVLLANLLLQLTFFMPVSSSNEYAQHLGGTDVFSGLVIGIPPAISIFLLAPFARIDQGVYARPLNIACACCIVGNALYALAYAADFLYLILIGRMVIGGGFTFFMYGKRYCSDPRLVGVRRRTTLAGWQVLCQGVGFSLGPFVGGLLSKIPAHNTVFNGFTAPGWLMAVIWAVYWVCVRKWFTDAPRWPEKTKKAAEAVVGVVENGIPLQPMASAGATPGNSTPGAHQAASQNGAATPVAMAGGAATPPVTMGSATDLSKGGAVSPISRTSASIASDEARPSKLRATLRRLVPAIIRAMTPAQRGVALTMCWFSMINFFILGAWEANIPVFTSSSAPENPFHFSPFAAGNMIALGGAISIPFLLLNLHFARRVQDRHTLALGASVGLAGLVIAQAVLAARRVTYASLLICWVLVALGFNIATTVTLALLSKQLPGEWNGAISVMIQCSNYVGRVTGAVWGGAGVKVGMANYVGLEIAYVGIGAVMFLVLWKDLKTKTG